MPMWLYKTSPTAGFSVQSCLSAMFSSCGSAFVRLQCREVHLHWYNSVGLFHCAFDSLRFDQNLQQLKSTARSVLIKNGTEIALYVSKSPILMFLGKIDRFLGLPAAPPYCFRFEILLYGFVSHFRWYNIICRYVGFYNT